MSQSDMSQIDALMANYYAQQLGQQPYSGAGTLGNSPGLGASPLNGAGQWNGDMSALPPGFNPYASIPQPNAPQGQVTQDQALGLLVQAYNDSGGQITPYIQNFGAQYGITPDQIQQTSDAYHKSYSGGMGVTDWLKDVGGLAGLTIGGLALAGGLGGAGAASGGLNAAYSGIVDPTLAGSGLAGGTAGATAGGAAGLNAAYSGIIDPTLTSAGYAGIVDPTIAGSAGGVGDLLGNAATGGGSGSGSASNLGPNGLPTGGNALGGTDAVNAGVGQLAGNTLGSIDWSKLLPSIIGGGLGLVDSLNQPDHTTTTQGGISNSTQTSGIQLPSQITGAAGTALDRANQLLTQGQQFASMPYGINKAAGDLATLGSNNAPLTSSFASGANINPYLDQTFNAAADATQNRLASEFGNAGQGISPQLGQARSQELQQLAAGIYGPGYQNAQQLQYGAQEAGVQRGLTQQDSNLNRTIQASQAALPIGQYMQQQAQAQANAPTTALNQYIGQLGGLSPYYPGQTTQTQATNQTGSVTQPLYSNPVAGALGGATLGNYFGSLFAPQQQGNSYTGMQTPQNMTIQPGLTNPYAYM